MKKEFIAEGLLQADRVKGEIFLRHSSVQYSKFSIPYLSKSNSAASIAK